MAGPRILFLSINFSQPTGGVRTLYRHVGVLRKHGYQASILQAGGTGEPFFEVDVPLINLDPSFQLQADDIIVIPEDRNEIYRQVAALPVKKIVFCQNHHYVFAGLGEGIDFSAYGVQTVVASSQKIAEFLEQNFAMTDVPVIRYGIDPVLYHPETKKHQIAYMPRKLGIQSDFIRQSFRHRYPDYSDLEWVRVENMQEKEAARHLRESALFLSLNRMEGFGLPPIEAMASGCLVIGFTGQGGDEYADDMNGFWCGQEDLQRCAERVAEAVAVLDDETATAARIAAGQKTAEYYSMENMEADLLGFWKSQIQG